jgi:ABC-type Fe3+/spermidine/putrescine transport system ATPase subunit
MIRIHGLSLTAGDFQIRDVSLSVAAGEYFVLLGPNGSGKTLLIHCLCGLRRAEAGTIAIGGRDMTHAEPRLRRIGYVPQDYGLFPHLDVAGNVAFALRARGMSHWEAMRQLAPLIDRLRLARLLSHMPQTLSGGERQKVALARAMALRPSLLLLDEPVSALDGPTRAEVLEQLRAIQREFAVATMHVCHSIDEAEAVADRAGVMIEGRLVQTGRLAELMQTPASAQVARLLQVHRRC